MNNKNIERYISGIEIDHELQDEIFKFKKILALSPHPDDMEFSAGGYLYLSSGNGAAVKLIVVSDGRKGSLDASDEETLVSARKKEQIEAAEILGIRDVTFLGYIDSEIPEPRHIRDRIMGEIRKFGPDLVITVDPNLQYEAHLDHVYVGKAVLEAVLLHSHPTIGEGKPESKRPNVALSATSNPNVIVNIDDAISIKNKSIMAHKSQIDSSGYVITSAQKSAELYARRIGCKYGEPLRLIEPEMLHMNTLSML